MRQGDYLLRLFARDNDLVWQTFRRMRYTYRVVSADLAPDLSLLLQKSFSEIAASDWDPCARATFLLVCSQERLSADTEAYRKLTPDVIKSVSRCPYLERAEQP